MARKRRGDELRNQELPEISQEAVQDEEITIDLMELLTQILDHWLLVVICAVLGTAIMGIYSFKIATPMYKSTSKLYVVNSKDSAINLSDLQIGNYLAQDYQEVFHNWHVQDQVIEELNLGYTYSQLNNMVSVSNPSNTRILYITVTSPNPEEARSIASTFAKVACEFIAVKMDQEQPNVFEEARLPLTPSSPNKSRNLMIGFLLGAIVAIAVVVIRYIADDKVRTPEDIEKLLGLPTLGVVTEQDSFFHGRSSGKKSKQTGKGGKA
ncbi:MAG: capsular biosynthesis protein [Clostridia bacterium]|nr:capsular biosynthesis protein [Clostridia bacterium]